jgi:hypothetical protein
MPFTFKHVSAGCSADPPIGLFNVYFGRLNPQEYIYAPNVAGTTLSYQQSLAANGIGSFVQIQTLINKTISELEVAPPASGSAVKRYRELDPASFCRQAAASVFLPQWS